MTSVAPDSGSAGNLFEAIARVDLHALEQALAAGADPDEVDLHGYQSTPLAWACAHGDEGAVRGLLQAGATLDLAAFSPPLVEAATHGFDDLVALLLEAGALVDARDESGASALWVAAAHGFSDIALRLVVAGATRGLADHDGLDPAGAARQAGHATLADWLEDPATVPAGHAFWRGRRKASRQAARARREAVLDRAAPGGAAPDGGQAQWTISGGIARGPWATQDFPSVAASGNAALVQRMLDTGLDPDWTMAVGTPTALMLAARSGQAAVVALLLARGADVSRRTAQDLTALHMALFEPSARVHTPVVRALVAAGADPDAADAQGQRPLHLALQHGLADIVQALVEAGADPFRRDRGGRMPADWAPASGRGAAAIRKILEAAAAAAAR